MAQVRITHLDGTVDEITTSGANQEINVQQGDKIEVTNATLTSATVDGNNYVITLADPVSGTIEITFVDLFLLLAVGAPTTTAADATTLTIGDEEVASIADALGQIATAAGTAAGGDLGGGLGDQTRSGGSRDAPEEFQAPDLGTDEAPQGPLVFDLPSDSFPPSDSTNPDPEEPVNLAPSAYSFAIDAEFSDGEGGGGGDDATEGSAIKTTLNVTAGDQFTFDFNFLDVEATQGDPGYIDFAFVVFGDIVVKLADVLSAPDGIVETDLGSVEQTGYNQFTITFADSGDLMFGFGVMNEGDTAVDAALLIDNVTFGSGGGLLLTSFEGGLPEGWVSIGNTSVVDDTFGIEPTDGEGQALMVAEDATDTEIELFFGLPASTLDTLISQGGGGGGDGFTALFDLGGTNDGISIGGTDPEDGLTTTYTITSLPSDGTLWSDEDQDGTYENQLQVGDVLVADGDELADNVLYVTQSIPEDGQDEFTYTTTDSDGLVSSPATVTIDFPTTTVSVDDANVSGGNAFEDPSLPGSDSLIFTVSLAEPVAGDVKVFFTLGGVAEAGTDYDVSGLTDEGGGVYSVVIAGGTSSATIELPIENDSDVEVSPESVEVTLTGTDSVVVTVDDGLGEGTITDLNGTITIDDASTVTEGSDLVYTVSMDITSGELAPGTSIEVFLTYGGTADASDIDGGLPGSIILTVDGTGLFATADLELTTATADGLEGDETLTVAAADGTTEVDGVVAEGITGGDATGTITESITVSVDDASVSDGNAFEDPSLPGSDSLIFTVSLDGGEINDTGGDVKIFYVLSGDADAVDDYDVSGLTDEGGGVYSVTIADGESSATIVLPVEDDPDVEPTPESVTVTLIDADNPNIGPGDTFGEGTITDLNGTITIDDASTVTEGSDLVYTVSMDITSGELAPGTSIEVFLTYGGTADASDIDGGLPGSIILTVDGTGLFATANLELTTATDDGLEGDETLTVAAADGTTEVDGIVAEGITGDDATGTITESITVSVDDAVIADDGNAFEDPSLPGSDSLTFTVSLSETNDTGGDITVFYTLGGVAVAGTDYSTAGLTDEGGGVYSVVIADGFDSATIVLPVENDPDVEPTPESVEVTLTGTDNGSVSIDDGFGEGTITDLNGTITISDSATVTEGDNLVYTVTMNITSGSLAPGTSIEVFLTYGGTADASDIDGSLPSSIILTVDGTGLSATADLTLTTVSGDGADGDETLTVAASDGTTEVDGVAAEGITGDDATGTILDGNTVPTADTPAAVAHDETAGLQDSDVAANGVLVGLADTASGLSLTAIGAVEQTLTFDVGADDGPSALLALDSSVDATLITGLTMTESGKVVYYFVDSDGLVLGVTVTDAANVGDGISMDEIEDVVFSMHLSTTDPTAGTATYTFIQYEAVVSPTGGDSSNDEGLTTPITIDYIVTDNDLETASATITTDIQDDGPTAGTADTMVITNTLSNSGTGDLNFVSFGSDGDGGHTLTMALAGDDSQVALVSDVTLVYGYVNGSGTATQLTSNTIGLIWHDNGDGSWSAVTDDANADVAFTVDVDPDGTYTVDMSGTVPLDGAFSEFTLDFTQGVTGGNNEQLVFFDSAADDLDPVDGIPDGSTIMALAVGTDSDGTTGTVNSSNQGMGVSQGNTIDVNDVDGTATSEELSLYFGDPEDPALISGPNDPQFVSRTQTFATIRLDSLNGGEFAIIVVHIAGTDQDVYFKVQGIGQGASSDEFVTITQGLEGDGSLSGDGLSAATAWEVDMSVDGFGTLTVDGSFDHLHFEADVATDSSYRLVSASGTSETSGFDVDTTFTATSTDGDGDTVDTIVDVTFDSGIELNGTEGSDVLIGDGGQATNQMFFGYGGNDTIDGGIGDDTINGGSGDDELTGGTGLDSFVYDGASDTAGSIDTILDFTSADDTFDFSALTNDVDVFTDVTFDNSGSGGDVVVYIGGESVAELNGITGTASVDGGSTAAEVALTIV